MDDKKPRPEDMPGKNPPPPPHKGPGEIPPHILKELFDLKEKVGKLEGMMEILLRQQGK